MTATLGAQQRPRRGAAQRTVLHVMPDLQIGGGQTIVLQGLRHLDPDLYRTVVVTLTADRNEMAPDFRRAGATVVELTTGATPRSGLALRRLLQEHAVDLIQTHNDLDRKVAQPVAALLGVPVVGHLHAEWNHLGSKAAPDAPALERWRSRLLSGVRDAAERRAVRHYVAESARVRQLFAPLVSAPITVLRQAVPVERYAAAQQGKARERVRRELGLAPDVPVLLDVSRLVPGKGQADLVPLLRQVRRTHPDAVLVLVGDGELRGDLEERARASGVADAVVLAGARSDVPEVMVAADVFVFPSYSEGFGMVALEAMAAALPVVAYDLPPFHEFMQPGVSADLVPVGDVDALTAAVVRVLSEPARAAAVGRAAAAHVAKEYPAESVAQVFEQVYGTVLDVVAPGERRPR